MVTMCSEQFAQDLKINQRFAEVTMFLMLLKVKMNY